MARDTPSAPAIERWPLMPERMPTMLCISCGDTMKHFRTIEKLGVRPGQRIFACPSCKGIDTKAVQRRHPVN